MHAYLSFGFTPWDLVFVVIISTQATIQAYVHQPRWKAVLFSLPFPITLMTLASNRSTDATPVIGMMLLVGFMHAIRWLHRDRHVPIVLAILICTLAYSGLGAALAQITPKTEAAFWTATAVSFLLALLLFLTIPYRAEPGHHSTLPVWVKWIIIVCVLTFLVASRNVLQGFATVFPIMGMMTAYEARHSLWTAARQAPVVTITVGVLIVTSHLAEPHIGLQLSLLPAWVAYLAVFVPITRYMWQRASAERALSPSRGLDKPVEA